MGKDQDQRRERGKNVAGKFGAGQGKKEQAESRPAGQIPRGFWRETRAKQTDRSMDRRPEKDHRPGQERHQYNRQIKPKGLDVLEFGREVTFEIVLDDEDAQEIRIAASAQNVPGQGGSAESGNAHWMQEPKRVVPAFGDPRPEQHRSGAENDGRRAFGQSGQRERKAKQN